MQGLRGYKNAKTELNNISSIFGHGTGANGAQSLTVEEVNVLVEHTPYVPLGINVGTAGTWNDTFFSNQVSPSLGIVYEMLIKRENTTDRLYWLASLCIYVNPSDAFFETVIVNGGFVSARTMYVISSNGREVINDGNYGVLPVVTLKSDVNYKSGDGTSSASDKIIKFQ